MSRLSSHFLSTKSFVNLIFIPLSTVAFAPTMAGGVAREFLNAINGFPVLSPPFVATFHGPIYRLRMPLPASWVTVYGVIVPIFCRVALSNQAHWFVDLCVEGLTWCFGRGWESFALHAGFQPGDELMFAYQSDGLFIVSLFDNGPPLSLFDDPVVAVADVQGLDALPDIQQLSAE
ncbi:uncharacterized protein LOC121768782 isoform X2 [Salvia splendens]|uniref:uncharacterized protein LOC121768782 isoform X2 n=1 Tax=Salvia splendens TaxID=180675 RepID=UPI001C26D0A2|nr:uncharacterized protein LOC121768782 isoform X2 [Salvia splendens]